VILTVILIACGFYLASVALLAGTVIICRKWYERERDRLLDELRCTIQNFITSPDEKTPSPLAQLTDIFASLFAARLMKQAKDMFAGVASVEAKGEQLALLEEATKDNPWLGILASVLPKKLRNSIMKHPQMVGALSKLGSGGSNHGAEVAPRKHRE
jgi:hypothetical protein